MGDFHRITHHRFPAVACGDDEIHAELVCITHKVKLGIGQRNASADDVVDSSNVEVRTVTHHITALAGVGYPELVVTEFAFFVHALCGEVSLLA